MSLITLNSNGQNPSLFNCHFPQAINIKPYSQVCLLKFLHFRDSTIYNITTSNNILQFCIGNTTQDAIRIVRLTPNQYKGADLAIEIALQMNSVLQQQNYIWSATYIPEDATTSPPTKEGFTIAYASQLLPDLSGSDYTQLGSDLEITGTSADDDNFIKQSITSDGTIAFTALDHKGIITDGGQYVVENLPLQPITYAPEDPLNVAGFVFSSSSIGICRDELANLENGNTNLLLDPLKQDVSIELGSNGIEISGIKIAGNTQLGSPTYSTRKLCRTIPPAVLKKLITDVVGKTGEDVVNLRFKFMISFVGVSRKCMIQMDVSYDCGQTFTEVDTATLGNDPLGNPYCATNSGLTSVIWNSGDATFNDEVAGVNQRIQNLVITKKAPFKPNFTFIDDMYYIGAPEIEDNTTFTNAATAERIFNNYVGVNDYDYVITDNATPAVIIGYLVADTEINPTTYTNANLMRISLTDVPYAGADLGTATYKTLTKSFDVVFFDTTAETWTTTEDIDSQKKNVESIMTQVIGNPVNRPVSNLNVVDGSPFLYDDEIHTMFNAVKPDEDLDIDPVSVGIDLQRQAILFLRQLNLSDVNANSGAPAYLKAGQSSGTLGSVIGSGQNIIVGGSSSGLTLFTSTEDTQKISKDTIINVSIPELSGVKSYNGIDSNAGKNLSGQGKFLAVLPREEFQTRGEGANGSLVYVAPFENWIDINNTNELNINQLSVEVRQPGGQIATDLRPDTITQIKLREDPHHIDARNANIANDRLIAALSSARQTGQILSKELYNTGS